MRRATAVLVLAGLFAIGSPAAVGATASSFRKVYVPRGMAAYEWHEAGNLPTAEVRRRLRFMRANGFNTIYLEIGRYLDAAELAPGTPGRRELLKEIRDRGDLLQGCAAFGKSEQLTGKPGRVLRCLAGFSEEGKQIPAMGRRVELGEADVARDDGEDVVQIVRNSAGERA